MADTLLENLQMVRENAYNLFKQQMTDLYKDRADSDFESFDCQLDMEQHIRGLEFRRMGCEMQLDKLDLQSKHAIEEVGNVKDFITEWRGTEDSEYNNKFDRVVKSTYTEPTSDNRLFDYMVEKTKGVELG